MGTRRDDYDDDDRPRRRRRYDDDDDDSDRPRRRPSRRRRGRSSGPGVGKVIGVIVGCLAGVGVVIAVVLAINGRGFGTGSITFDQYKAIGEKDTIEGLEKQYGRGKKIDPSQWNRSGPGMEDARGSGEFGTKQGTTLAGYSDQTQGVTAWYRWKKGLEEVFVAEGTDLNGRKGLVVKLYWNPKVLEDAVRKGTRPAHAWFAMEQIGVGGRFEMGGNGQ